LETEVADGEVGVVGKQVFQDHVFFLGVIDVDHLDDLSKLLLIRDEGLEAESRVEVHKATIYFWFFWSISVHFSVLVLVI
jgi:hypothetical protein